MYVIWVINRLKKKKKKTVFCNIFILNVYFYWLNVKIFHLLKEVTKKKKTVYLKISVYYLFISCGEQNGSDL